MRFKITDYFDYYRIEGNTYSIYLFNKGMPAVLSKEEYLNIVVEKVKYYCRRDGVSWISAFSTTDSDTAVQVPERTGKVGRPRKTVQGKKVDGHTHTLIVGNADKSAHSTAQAIKKSIDKKYKKKTCQVVSKGDNAHAYNFIDYSMRQADIVRTGGDFDFTRYLNEHEFFS